mmetsp:Transcript_3546/g.9642  ORF Transcript_3546/g.9642 Transcript_3546/m.9642 type:complete len:398 (-) Transcript_3546:60-1253(-)
MKIERFLVVVSVILIRRSLSQASGEVDITGEYSLACSSKAGLPSSWRIMELDVIFDDTGFWTTTTIVYSDPACTAPAFRYDERARYRVLDLVESSEWVGEPYLEPTYNAVKYFERKEVTVIDRTGEAFLGSICPGVDFFAFQSYDMMDLTCSALFFECAESHNAEYGCIHVGTTGSLVQCQHSPTGSCTPSDAVYAYAIDENGDPLQCPLVSHYPSRDDILGTYTQNCSTVLGLPSNMYVSARAMWYRNTVSIRSGYFMDSKCEDRIAFSYLRTYNWQMGYELAPPIGLTSYRELSTQYLTKELRNITEYGRDFLRTLCPENNWDITEYRNVIDLDCIPFWFGCRWWNNEEQVAVGLDDYGNLGLATNSVTGSCTTATRGTDLLLTGYGTPILFHPV